MSHLWKSACIGYAARGWKGVEPSGWCRQIKL